MQQITIHKELNRTGHKVQGHLQVADMELFLPATVICGKCPGKTILITGGIHNAEYVGIQAAIELAKQLEPAEVNGKVIILPLVNRTGFEHRTMSVVYEDNKNLNREFPGKPDGTLAEQICWFIEKEIFTYSDYYIDLHCGDGYEQLAPYVYCQGKAHEDVKKKSREMACQVQVPYIVESQSGSGGAYNYAGSIGLPGILIERGNLGVWSREEVDADKRDVINILQKLGFINSERTLETDSLVVQQAVVITETIYENANETGCWYPAYRAGDVVESNAVLGVIKDYFGNVLKTYTAAYRSVILYQTGSLCVLKDGPVIAYGKLY